MTTNKLVPLVPTEQQWGGLARDIMMAFDLNAKTPRKLLEHLGMSGADIPAWLRDEVGDGESDSVLSKGTRAVIIYRAMVEAAPVAEQAQQAEPVALSLPFFAYDSETGFERFATEAEAKAAAQESIDAYREEAGEGWAEAVENICWGVVLGTTREVALPDEYSGGNGLADDMKPVDYVLADAAQPPAVAIPEGYALVPIEPVLQQVNDQFVLAVLNWWWHRNNAASENTLRHELEESGLLPGWFKSHWIYHQDRTPNFGVHSSDIAELIYRAMLAAAQKGGAA